MATPTYEELLKGQTRWSFSCEGMRYQLSHHGYRAPKPDSDCSFDWDGHPGAWCFYIILPEQMYPDIWPQFACQRIESGFECHGPAWDDDWFHGGITWSSSEPYWDRKTQRMWDAAKVGCDYNHLWDSESGYPDTFLSVKSDAERACKALIGRYPERKFQSDWSGR